jgi:triacylglycerol lipase
MKTKNSLPRFRMFLLFAALLPLLTWVGCAPTKVLCPADYHVDFVDAARFAEKAELAYEPDSSVLKSCAADSCFILTGAATGARAYVQRDDSARVQWIAFRGTQTISDVRLDANYTQRPDTALGIYLHRGFAAAEADLMPSVLSHLREGYATRITGHSLGGAVAVIAALRLKSRGYAVRCVTFGQPKVTNAEGARKAAGLDLLRFIQGKDLVTVVPPVDWKPGERLGAFEHFGREVALEGQGYECLQEHYSQRFNPSGWWDHIQAEALEDHKIARYQAKLNEQASRQAAVK